MENLKTIDFTYLDYYDVVIGAIEKATRIGRILWPKYTRKICWIHQNKILIYSS